MRLSRLPAALVAGALLAGAVSCAATIDGTGTLAADVATGSATPQSTDSPAPQPTSDSPTPEPTTPSPTTNPLVVKERLLCVLERSAIASVNSQFNKSKDRATQIRILRGGATTIKGHISRSGLPATDVIRRSGQGVLDQLNRLVGAANAGGAPSTAPYNQATQKFQTACNTIS